MEQTADDALRSQCLQRAWLHAARLSGNLTATQVEVAASWLADRVRRNRDRIPVNVPCNPETGVPDSYIDEVISFAALEGTRVVALKIGRAKTWNEMLVLIMRRVHASLRRFGVVPSEVDALSAELIQHCACLVWEAIDRFHYDSCLDAWVSRLVAYEVSNLCRSSSFRWNANALSLECSPSDEYEDLLLGEVLPDARAEHELGTVDAKLVLEAGWEVLSADQQEVLRRRLRGEDMASIADAMGRSLNAIYKLQQRANATLQTFVCK